MLLPDLVPLPPQTGGFLLAEWKSPAGYRWDVAAVRTSWRAGFGPEVQTPALVLSPRALPAVPYEDLRRAFEAFLEKTGPPLEKSAESGDRAWAQAPTWQVDPNWSRITGLADLWRATTESLEEVEGLVDAGLATPRALADLWRDAPWMFLLHHGLQRIMGTALGLPPAMDPADVQAAAVQTTQSPARRRSWPPARIDALRPWTRHPLPSDVAYDRLMRDFPGNGLRIVSFLEGGAEHEFGMGHENLPKRASERFGHLRRAYCAPTLVPLHGEVLPVEAAPGAVGEDPILLLWIQARAVRCLWLAFGGQVAGLSFHGRDGAGSRVGDAPSEPSRVDFDGFTRRRVTVQAAPLAGHAELHPVGVGFDFVLLDPTPQSGGAGEVSAAQAEAESGSGTNEG